MFNELDLFTSEQVEQVNAIYAKHGEGLTPDEVDLLVAFEKAKAAHQARTDAETQAMQELAETKARAALTHSQKATAAYMQLVEDAKRRLEMIDNGQA